MISFLEFFFGCFHKWSDWSLPDGYPDHSPYSKQSRICKKCARVQRMYTLE